MSEFGNYRRAPAITCWIKHILEGEFIEDERCVLSIFGELRRVRLVGTVRDKQEFIDNEDPTKSRVVLYVDDGTGLINATIWQDNIDKYSFVEKGTIIQVIGKSISRYKSFSVEHIKVIEDPNELLLQDACITKRILNGEYQELTQMRTDEISIDGIFGESESDTTSNDKGEALIEKIYDIINTHESGISFSDLSDEVEIPKEELTINLKTLITEGRIYPADDKYHSY